MNHAEQQYLEILEALRYGTTNVKEDRTGTGTYSLFGTQIRHNMRLGFPLLTTKKMAWKQIVTELMWFLKGQTNIKPLLEQGNYIWVGDAMKNYEKHNGPIDWGPYISKEEAFIESILNKPDFASQWGNLGPVYGAQWRQWKTGRTVALGHNGNNAVYGEEVIDQIQNLFDTLRDNPDSRRIMVNAWNVAEIDKMVLPPCHYGFQVYTRVLTDGERIDYALNNQLLRSSELIDAPVSMIVDKLNNMNVPTRGISLMWNQRSADFFLGVPFNIASYGLLLHILANAMNMVPEELIGNFGDTHLYKNHVDQAKEQLLRTPSELPKLVLPNEPFENWSHARYTNPDTSVDYLFNNLNWKDIKVEGYNPYPAISAPLSN